MLKKKLPLLLAVLIAFEIVGCNSSGTEANGCRVEGLEKLGKIKVISRGEGSGTRSVFAELTGFAETDGQADATDLTTKNSQIEHNAEDVMKAVKLDSSAIGYVSTGAMDETLDVKTLAVNGITADENTIEKGEYHG